MAHHDIIIINKVSESFPEFIVKALKKFMSLKKELDGDVVDMSIHKSTCGEQIRFNHNGWCWTYGEDIEELIELDKITEDLIEAYRWLLENTTIKSDCWNTCDSEYGPDSWDDFKLSVLCCNKQKITQFKIKHNL